ncbi:MAG: hypothetical protein ABI361_13140 [Nitrososphaera sp.]
MDSRITDLQARLAETLDFDAAFELVKSAVFAKFRMHRAGLSLILQVMPGHVGAYHVLGSNAIVVNSYVLNAIKRAASSLEEYNAYIFMVLAHEYLHSLGITNENTVRQMTFELCSSALGPTHMAARMAKEDPTSLFRNLNLPAQQFGKQFQLVKKFDTKNQSYIQ